MSDEQSPASNLVSRSVQAGRNVVFAIGATLVYFQSSSLTVGNPICSNSANDFSRRMRSQVGSFAQRFRMNSENSAAKRLSSLSNCNPITHFVSGQRRLYRLR